MDGWMDEPIFEFQLRHKRTFMAQINCWHQMCIMDHESSVCVITISMTTCCAKMKSNLFDWTTIHQQKCARVCV